MEVPLDAPVISYIKWPVSDYSVIGCQSHDFTEDCDVLSRSRSCARGRQTYTQFLRSAPANDLLRFNGIEKCITFEMSDNEDS